MDNPSGKNDPFNDSSFVEDGYVSPQSDGVSDSSSSSQDSAGSPDSAFSGTSSGSEASGAPLRDATKKLFKQLYNSCKDSDYGTVKCIMPEIRQLAKSLHATNLLNQPNIKDRYKRTPLLAAMEGGNIDLVTLLLENGADPKRETKAPDSCNAMMLAFRFGHTAIAEYLLDHEYFELENSDNIFNYSLLHQAAYGQVDCVKMLIRRGANVNASSAFQVTPLHSAVSAGNPQVVAELLSHGAQANAVDKFGRTSLYLACNSFNLVIVKLLVEEGKADVNITDTNHNSAFDIADKKNLRETCRYLLQHGAIPRSIKENASGLGTLRFFRPYIKAGNGHPDLLPTARTKAALSAVGTKLYLNGGVGLKTIQSRPDEALFNHPALLTDLFVLDLNDRKMQSMISPADLAILFNWAADTSASSKSSENVPSSAGVSSGSHSDFITSPSTSFPTLPSLNSSNPTIIITHPSVQHLAIPTSVGNAPSSAISAPSPVVANPGTAAQVGFGSRPASPPAGLTPNPTPQLPISTFSTPAPTPSGTATPVTGAASGNAIGASSTSLPTGHTPTPLVMSREARSERVKVSKDGLVVQAMPMGYKSGTKKLNPPFRITASTAMASYQPEPQFVACVKATAPYSRDKTPIAYWEINVLEATEKIMTIGFTHEDFPLNRYHPGWCLDSYAYHNDDGSAFHVQSAIPDHGLQWGPRFSTGDIVGAGINFMTNEVFFTKNGKFLGVAYRGVTGNDFFATISFGTVGAKAKVNCGRKAFKFSFSVPTLSWTKLGHTTNSPLACIPHPEGGGKFIQISYGDAVTVREAGLVSQRGHRWHNPKVCILDTNPADFEKITYTELAEHFVNVPIVRKFATSDEKRIKKEKEVDRSLIHSAVIPSSAEKSELTLQQPSALHPITITTGPQSPRQPSPRSQSPRLRTSGGPGPATLLINPAVPRPTSTAATIPYKGSPGPAGQLLPGSSREEKSREAAGRKRRPSTPYKRINRYADSSDSECSEIGSYQSMKDDANDISTRMTGDYTDMTTKELEDSIEANIDEDAYFGEGALNRVMSYRSGPNSAATSDDDDRSTGGWSSGDDADEEDDRGDSDKMKKAKRRRQQQQYPMGLLTPNSQPMSRAYGTGGYSFGSNPRAGPGSSLNDQIPQIVRLQHSRNVPTSIGPNDFFLPEADYQIHYNNNYLFLFSPAGVEDAQLFRFNIVPNTPAPTAVPSSASSTSTTDSTVTGTTTASVTGLDSSTQSTTTTAPSIGPTSSIPVPTAVSGFTYTWSDLLMESPSLRKELTKLVEPQSALIHGHFYIFSSTTMCKVDIQTLKFEMKQLSGVGPRGANFASTVIHAVAAPLVEGAAHILCFGGVAGNIAQSNVHTLDVVSGEWDVPHLSGVYPRPRVEPGGLVYIGGGQNIIVIQGGWNGKNYIDDLDFLHLEDPIAPDPLERAINNAQLSDFTIYEYEDAKVTEARLAQKVASSHHALSSSTGASTKDEKSTMPSTPEKLPSSEAKTDTSPPHIEVSTTTKPEEQDLGNNPPAQTPSQPAPTTTTNHEPQIPPRKSLLVNRIILACRSSFFKNLFELEPERKEFVLEPTTDFALFSAFIKYLYTDEITPDLIDDTNASAFISLFRHYAPKHRERVLEELVITRPAIKSTMSADLTVAYDNPLWSDVELVVDAKDEPQIKLNGHRAILCTRNEVFGAMFLNAAFAEPQKKEVVIKGSPANVVKELIRYLYTLEINEDNLTDEKMVIDLLIVAHRYRVKGLQTLTSEMISSKFTTDNVISLLLLAEQLSVKKLMKSATAFIRTHYDIISKTEDFHTHHGVIIQALNTYFSQ